MPSTPSAESERREANRHRPEGIALDAPEAADGDAAPAAGAASAEPELGSADLAAVTLASIGDGVIRTDAFGRVDYLNRVAERLTGWRLDEARRRDITEVYQVVNELAHRPRLNPVERCLAERTTQSPPGLFVLRGRDGDESTIRDTVSPLVGAGGELLGAVVVFRDLTHVRSLERQMAFLTTHDPLTGLLNRQDFEVYVEAALESARDFGSEHALLHLDLLELKLINDSFGHVAGDELLRQVADLMRREAGDGAVLGRIVGSDFTVLLDGRGERLAAELANRLQSAIGDYRFSWAGQTLEVGFQIGIVAVTPDSPSVAHLMRAADAACHRSRAAGHGRIYVYDAEADGAGEHQGRLQWVQRIRQALSADRFKLYHQRIDPLAGGRGLHEILLRMLDEGGEPVLPSRFIPIAESHDLAPLIDRWVVRRVLNELERRPGLFGGAALTLNLSGQTLGDEVFLRDLINHLKGADVDASRLYFEITETHAVANLSRALRFIRQLKDLGCRFVLDDFGSGFASFAYLRSLPVDLVKIDGQFVREVTRDPVARAMVASIHEIAGLMGLPTIAEWIEDDETLSVVRQLGIEYVRGYKLHRPAPIDGAP
ncbi:MAG: EAL domain-containing protein [Acidobacteriota bacterium]